jgi:hypothetical protein
MIEKWKVDNKVRIDKINKLSEFQAFAMIMIIYKLCLASINPCSAEVKNPAVRKLKSMHLAI